MTVNMFGLKVFYSTDKVLLATSPIYIMVAFALGIAFTLF